MKITGDLPKMFEVKEAHSLRQLIVKAITDCQYARTGGDPRVRIDNTDLCKLIADAFAESYVALVAGMNVVAVHREPRWVVVADVTTGDFYVYERII